MKTLVVKFAATLTLGILLATNPFSGVQAEDDPWAVLETSTSTMMAQPSISETSTGSTDPSSALGVPCSTGQGLEMSDCRLEYITSNGAMLTWKTQWPSDTGYDIGSTTLKTDALTKLDKMGGQLTREHRVALSDYTIDEDHTYVVKAQGSAPNGHSGISDPLTLKPRPNGTFAPSAELPANLPTTMHGTVNVAVEVAGDYRDVSLFYALEGSNGSLTTSYRMAATLRENVPGTANLRWDTTTVANGRYTLIAAAQNAQGYSLGWSVKRGITVSNGPACIGSGPCGISVTNAADPQHAGFAPGAALTIYGQNLSTTTQSAVGVPLPQNLGDTRVWFDIDGVRTAGYLFFVSPTMINVQLPLDSMQSNVSFSTPRTSIEATAYVATTQGISEGRSITIKPFAPGLFTSAGVQGNVPVMLHASDTDPSKVVPVSEVPESERAHVGEVVMLFGTGMGLSTVTLPPRPSYSFAGQPAPGKPFFELLRSDNNPDVKLYIGSRAISSNQLRFGFKAPFMVGIDQVNFVVPSDLSDGTYDIKICFMTECSNVGKIPVSGKAARYPETVKINSYVNGPLVDHSFAPTGGTVEIGEEGGIHIEPSPNPTPDPTPSPTDGCGNIAWGQDCLPPIAGAEAPSPTSTPLSTEVPSWTANSSDPWQW